MKGGTNAPSSLCLWGAQFLSPGEQWDPRDPALEGRWAGGAGFARSGSAVRGRSTAPLEPRWRERKAGGGARGGRGPGAGRAREGAAEAGWADGRGRAGREEESVCKDHGGCGVPERTVRSEQTPPPDPTPAPPAGPQDRKGSGTATIELRAARSPCPPASAPGARGAGAAAAGFVLPAPSRGGPGAPGRHPHNCLLILARLYSASIIVRPDRSHCNGIFY